MREWELYPPPGLPVCTLHLPCNHTPPTKQSTRPPTPPLTVAWAPRPVPHPPTSHQSHGWVMSCARRPTTHPSQCWAPSPPSCPWGSGPSWHLHGGRGEGAEVQQAAEMMRSCRGQGWLLRAGCFCHPLVCMEKGDLGTCSKLKNDDTNMQEKGPRGWGVPAS